MADLFFDGNKVRECKDIQINFNDIYLSILKNAPNEISELFEKENLNEFDMLKLENALLTVEDACKSIRGIYDKKYEKIRENKELEQYL